MNWGSLANFLQMGGYGGYVWTAYGVTALVVVAEIVALRARRRAAVQEIAQRRGAASDR